MNSIAKQHQPAGSPLEALYTPIAAELAGVEELLREQLQSKYSFVDELVRYGCLLGGKRLRPALLLLAGKAVGRVTHEHQVLATVVEMIHTATLVHDDVLDQADMRRHLPTVNARWDIESSVLLGDYLFTHAFYLASTLDSAQACRLIGRATNVVCEGEIRQKGSRGDFALSEQAYLEIIEAKTAALCACSCWLGAHYAGGDDGTVKLLEQYGRYLGIAFQIADDLLDVTGDEQETGKSLGTDLDGEKPTLPVIRALDQADADQRHELLDLLRQGGPEAQAALQPYFERFQAIEYTRDKALEYAGRAREALEPLDDSPATEILRALTEFVVARSK